VLRRSALAGLAALLGLALGPGAAGAVGPPQVGAAWVTGVTASGADLRAGITPEGALTRYRFEYLSAAAYAANLAASPPREGFFGALKAPPNSEPGVGAGTVPVEAVQHIGGLTPLTTYRYRVRATSVQGTTFGPEHTLTTQGTELIFSLPDARGWEMVSPVDKNGGAIESVGTTASRVFQVAADGQSATYSSIFSFANPAGAPNASQYLARRGADGWASEDITIPLFSGSYGDEPATTPYQLFSPDLARGLVLSGRRCRGLEGECMLANPPLPGTAAPAGYRNYYRREANGPYTALLTQADVANLAVSPQNFELRMVAASPDLEHVLLSSCAALSADASEVQTGPGACDGAKQNLYERSPGAGLELINLLPGASTGTPGARVAAQARAVSADGRRVYWVEEASANLYLRTASGTIQVDATAGGGGAFETASADGSVAYFTKEGHLYRFLSATETATDLTPGGAVQGVLGASDDGSYVYYLTAAGLMQWHDGVTTAVAAAADASNYPPATGTARISSDGRHLLFLSSAGLTGYDNAGKQEVFLYGPPPGGGAASLTCVSCNPTGERPLGPSTIAGAVANGTGPEAIAIYKPRSLSVGGARVFFDSGDALVVADTNARPDVYQWEAAGVGSCASAGGCVTLLASGRSAEGSSFVDASADGADAFFLTDGSLVPGDPGLVDLYDARVGGGLPVAGKPIPCIGDACQPLPPAPEDPTPGTLVSNPGNPPAPVAKKKAQKKKSKRQKKSGKNRRAKGKRAAAAKGSSGR
jgi:hypothetical protein